MNNTVLIAFFAFLLITTIVTFVSLYKNLKTRSNLMEREKDNLQFSYDQIRKEKLNMDDQYQQAINQERTYKVAFEDWKSKYDLLDLKYNTLKKEFENKLSNPIEIKSPASVESASLALEDKKSNAIHTTNSDLNQLTTDLRSILNQHLEILSKIINSDQSLELGEIKVKSDPLHWIMGIDEDTSNVLKNQGIRTFEQLYELPKKEIRKLMLQFEDIDERIIESWPMQAGAIIRSKEESKG